MGQSDWVVPDETGWQVGGHPAWLHALVGPEATAYVIDPTRSGSVAEGILGFDYDGTPIHDGWSPTPRLLPREQYTVAVAGPRSHDRARVQPGDCPLS